MVLDPARLAACEQDGLCDLLEVFSSVQGEGPRVGERHLFVRFSQCDMKCAYCDTPMCHGAHDTARVEETPGGGLFRQVENPVSIPDLRSWVVSALRSARHRAVALTGGEPLLQPWVIEALAPSIREADCQVLLESDGNLPDAYAEVHHLIDVLSLDWKAPSATGERARYEEHVRMLALCSGEAYVKLVYVADTPVEEVRVAARAIAETRRDVPLVLQPCTPFGSVRVAPRAEHGISLAETAAEHLPDVRVIPQVHKLLDVL